jgi:hypothetical protein
MGANRPIFVLGCPRSGTTLLQLMLHAHPRIAVPPETRFLVPVYRRRNEFGDLREEANRRALARAIVEPKRTRCYELGLDPSALIEEIVDGPPTIGSAFGAVFRAYAARFGKPRWGDKRPGYYQDIPTLLRLFPDAQIVHLVRDGRDCVASLKSMPWYKGDVHTAVATWAQAVDWCRRAARRLPADAFFELRYERLVADPPEQLTALCEFLGEAYDPAMTEPNKIADKVIPRRKKWHASTRTQVTAGRSGTYRDRLEPWEIALCETALGRRLRAYGYEPSGAGRAPAGDLARFVRISAMRRGAGMKRAAVDLLRRTRETGPVHCRL